MSNFPRPPGSIHTPMSPSPATPAVPPNRNNRSPRDPSLGTVMPSITPPAEPSGELTANEMDIILTTTLLPQHRNDPNILRFISSFVRCRNKRQAALEAGLPPHAGTSLYNRPDIAECIRAITDKSAHKYGYDASEIVERVKEVSEIDPVELEREDGTFKTSMREIAPETRRGIKKFKAKNIYENDPNGMKVLVGQLIEVEFWDKLKAIEMLGREKDTFKETRKIEHDVTGRMADVLLESKRLAQSHIDSINNPQLPPPKDVTPINSTTLEVVEEYANEVRVDAPDNNQGEE